jgi:hypothetical protein
LFANQHKDRHLDAGRGFLYRYGGSYMDLKEFLEWVFSL